MKEKRWLNEAKPLKINTIIFVFRYRFMFLQLYKNLFLIVCKTRNTKVNEMANAKCSSFLRNDNNLCIFLKNLGVWFFFLVFVCSNGLASFFCHPKYLQDSEKQVNNDFSDKLTT